MVSLCERASAERLQPDAEAVVLGRGSFFFTAIVVCAPARYISEKAARKGARKGVQMMNEPFDFVSEWGFVSVGEGAVDRAMLATPSLVSGATLSCCLFPT
jgi:predicted hydrocarbon binding protein